MTNARIRPAVAADVPEVRAVVDVAFRPYVARIGVVPVPMEADHAANVAAGRVFVAELADDGGTARVAASSYWSPVRTTCTWTPSPSSPTRRAPGSDGCCWSSRRPGRGRSDCRRSGSSRTP